MKKLLLAGIIVLAVLLAFPMAVSAANTVTVSGSIANTISVNVNLTGTFLSNNMVAGQTYTNNSALLNTTTTSYSWHTDASDQKVGLQKGYMNRTPTANLTYPFQLSKDGSSYSPLTSDYTNFMSGSSAGAFEQLVYQKQLIVVTDSQGAYSITVTFTGVNL